MIRESTTEAIDLRVGSIASELQAMRDEMRRLFESQERSSERLETVREMVSAEFDEVPFLGRELRRIRQSAEYEQAFGVDEPLVSVRIATYNNPQLLVERAIASVLAQTYERIEVIVVGDACTDDTEKCVAAVGDPRIRFFNLPVRGGYPEDPRNRWLVAGSPAMNFGAQLAQGLWIAPLDHDDEFVPDHVETLLAAARSRELELAYGKLLAITPDGRDNWEIGVFPPRLGEFGFQGAIHPTALRFFEYNPKSWIVNEPGDWNLCRRMLEAGVRIGLVEKVVTRYYPGPFGLAPRDPQGDA